MKPLAAFIAAAVILTACSGDDDTAPTASTTDVVSTTVADTTARTTTSPVATTSAAPTTTTTTTTDPAPSTSPPVSTAVTSTTGVGPAETLAAQLAQDAQQGDDMLSEVLADPTAAGGDERLRSFFAGEALDIALDLLQQFKQNDLVVAAHPTIERTFAPVGQPEFIGGAGNEKVVVETCRLDSDIVMAPLDGTDERFPLDGDIVHTEAVSTFELVDGVWKLESWVSTAESTGDVTCG